MDIDFELHLSEQLHQQLRVMNRDMLQDFQSRLSRDTYDV